MQYKSKFFKICLMLAMLNFLVVPDISQGRINEQAINFNFSGGHAHDGINEGTQVPFGNLIGNAIDSQIPNTITINEATNADTVDGAHAATLEESAEIDADITTHKGEGSAHTAANLTNVSAGDVEAVTVQAAIDEVSDENIATSERGVANGVAELDANGNTTIEQLPPDVKTDIFYCGNESCQITAGADPAGLWTDVQGKWKLDDDGTWADVSGNGNDMSEFGTPINEDGFLGGINTAIYTDGNSEGLTISDVSQIGLDIMTDEITLSAWIYMESNFAQNTSIVCAGSPNTSSSSSYCFYVTAAEKLALTLAHSSGHVTYTGTTILSFDTWYHVVGTLGSNVIRIFINNVEEGSGASFTYSINHDDDPDFRIGNNWGSTREWLGRIDDVAVWSRELTSGNRGALYALNEDFEVAPGASGDPVGEGDVCIRTDQNIAYMHNGGTDTAMTDWDEIAATTDYVDTDHGGVANAHHTKTTLFTDLVDSAIDAQIPDTITIDNATDCDTVDGAHAAALEESAEIDSDISTHVGIVSSHHSSTSNTYNITPATVTTTGDIKINSDSTSDQLLFGTTGDVNLYRSAANVLATDDAFRVDGAIFFGTAADTNIYRSSADVLRTNDAFQVDGFLYFGSAADTNLYRSAANVLATDDSFRIFGGSGLSLDTDLRFFRQAAKTLNIDDNAGSDLTKVLIRTLELETTGDIQIASAKKFLIGADVNLYRSAADTLKTDDTLQVAGSLVMTGDASTIIHASTAKVMSFNAAEFGPHKSADFPSADWDGSYDSYIIPDIANSSYYYAVLGVHLPNGATVTGVSAFGYTSDAGDDVDFYMFRTLLTSSSVSTMAQGGFGGGGTSDTDSTITNAVINNNSYSYKLIVFLQADDTQQHSQLFNMGISYTTTDMSMTQ